MFFFKFLLCNNNYSYFYTRIYTVSYVFILLFFSALTIIYRYREKKQTTGYVLLYVLQRSRNIMVLNKIKKRYARMYQKHNLQSNKATKLTKTTTKKLMHSRTFIFYICVYINWDISTRFHSHSHSYIAIRCIIIMMMFMYPLRENRRVYAYIKK